MGDTKKLFKFTMKIEKDGDPYTESLKVGNNTYNVNKDNEYEFSLKHMKIVLRSAFHMDVSIRYLKPKEITQHM